MGDIICRNCGEPWDAYGARHGDMSQAEYQMLITGKGCPSCHGKPVYDCTKFQGIYIPFKELKDACGWLKWGMTCSNPFDCEFKKARKRVDDIDFLSSLDNNTDGNEALNAAMDLEFGHRRRKR